MSNNTHHSKLELEWACAYLSSKDRGSEHMCGWRYGDRQTNIDDGSSTGETLTWSDLMIFLKLSVYIPSYCTSRNEVNYPIVINGTPTTCSAQSWVQGTQGLPFPHPGKPEVRRGNWQQREIALRGILSPIPSKVGKRFYPASVLPHTENCRVRETTAQAAELGYKPRPVCSRTHVLRLHRVLPPWASCMEEQPCFTSL